MAACGVGDVSRALRLLATVCSTRSRARAQLAGTKLARASLEASRRGDEAFAHALRACGQLAGGGTALQRKLNELEQATDPHTVSVLLADIARLDEELMADAKAALQDMVHVMRRVLAGEESRLDSFGMKAWWSRRGGREDGTRVAPERVRQQQRLLRQLVKRELARAQAAVEGATLHRDAVKSLQLALEVETETDTEADIDTEAETDVDDDDDRVVHIIDMSASASGALPRHAVGDDDGDAVARLRHQPRNSSVVRCSSTVPWQMAPFSRPPWKWMRVPADGDCFFHSLRAALLRPKDPTLHVPEVTTMRKRVAEHIVGKDTDAEPRATMAQYMQLASLPDVMPPWLQPLADSMRKNTATMRDHRRVLKRILLDKDMYWANETAIAYLEEALQVMIMVVDAHRDMKTMQRFSANALFVHTAPPKRIVVLRLSGSTHDNNGHYTPLYNTQTKRASWTPETLPPFLRSRFCHGLKKSPWFTAYGD